MFNNNWFAVSHIHIITKRKESIMATIRSYFEFHSEELYQDETTPSPDAKISIETSNTDSRSVTRIVQEEFNSVADSLITGSLNEVLDSERHQLIDIFESLVDEY